MRSSSGGLRGWGRGWWCSDRFHRGVADGAEVSGLRHASDVALDALEPLLGELRKLDGLTERKRGVFYRRSSAFLHFHEDAAGFFADAKVGPGWRRFDVTTGKLRREFVRAVRNSLV
jgi:hypothetical protein